MPLLSSCEITAIHWKVEKIHLERSRTTFLLVFWGFCWVVCRASWLTTLTDELQNKGNYMWLMNLTFHLLFFPLNVSNCRALGRTENIFKNSMIWVFSIFLSDKEKLLFSFFRFQALFTQFCCWSEKSVVAVLLYCCTEQRRLLDS